MIWEAPEARPVAWAPAGYGLLAWAPAGLAFLADVRAPGPAAPPVPSTHCQTALWRAS